MFPGVNLILKDFNLDGFVDVLLRGLGSAITGELDRIVYAPGGKVGGHPAKLKTVDAAFKKFLTEVNAWIDDPGYFDNNAVSTTNVVSGFTIVYQCLDDESSNVYYTDYPCPFNHTELDKVYEPFTNVVTVISYGNFNGDALEFSRQFSLVDGRARPNVALGSTRAKKISEILLRVFGVNFFNGQLERSCTGVFAYDSQISLPCNDSERVGRIVLAQALSIEGLCLNRNAPDCNGSGHTDIGEFRLLTPAEQQLAIDNGLSFENLKNVRVYRISANDSRLKGNPNAWFDEGGHIHVPSARGDNRSFEEEFTSVNKKSVLVHEFTHIWHDYNPHVVHRFVVDPMPKDYVYRNDDGTLMAHPNGEVKRFEHYTNEQQAEIMQDRYIFSQSTTAGVMTGNLDSDFTTKQMFDQLNDIPGIPGGSVP